jgi:hypothetical protein
MFQSQCEIDGCYCVPVAKELCSKHYQQQRSGKHYPKKCKINNCNKKYHAKGFCTYHYKRDRYIKSILED